MSSLIEDLILVLLFSLSENLQHCRIIYSCYSLGYNDDFAFINSHEVKQLHARNTPWTLNHLKFFFQNLFPIISPINLLYKSYTLYLSKN